MLGERHPSHLQGRGAHPQVPREGYQDESGCPMAEFSGLLELAGSFQQLVLASLAIVGRGAFLVHFISADLGERVLWVFCCAGVFSTILCEVYMSSKHTSTHYLS